MSSGDLEEIMKYHLVAWEMIKKIFKSGIIGFDIYS